MRLFGDVSIRKKLRRITMLTTSVALLLTGVAFVVYELAMFRSVMTRELMSMADIVGANSTAALAFKDSRAGEETLAALRADPRIVSASIYTKEGEVFATYQRADLRESVVPTRPREDSASLRRGSLILFRPIILDRERIGTIYIQSDLQEVYARLRRYTIIVGVVLLASSLAALFLSSQLQGVISGPILHLAQTARIVSDKQDYSVRAVGSSRDELGLLTDGFNEMLTQIQRRDMALQEAHALVRESEQRFRSLIETAQDAVVTMDHNGRITLVNHAAERVFGYPEQEILGQHFSLLAPEQKWQPHRRGLGQHLRSGESVVLGQTTELVGLRKGCEEFLMEMSLSVVEHQGLPLFTAIIRDITERKRIEAELKALTGDLERKVEDRTRALKEAQVQLIQSEKLAALGTLAAGVAHELNQPLMVVRGYAQELLADERIADEEIREDLCRIEAQTTRMGAIITHLRDFSRQSHGEKQVTDLNRVVTQAFTFLGQQLKTRNIAVVQALDPVLPSVWADPLQLEQVLLNLVTNARDAMEGVGTGTITISTTITQDGRVALAVTDTGPGIPLDLRSRIFDPFFTTKEVGKGTGLGLSICYGIVKAHGGEIRVESPVADGRGAMFTIVLPPSPRTSGGSDRA